MMVVKKHAETETLLEWTEIVTQQLHNCAKRVFFKLAVGNSRKWELYVLSELQPKFIDEICFYT